MQGLKEVTMHEVGHTLGLRHNFKSSTLYTIDELNDTDKTKETGLTGSVMDYSPANIMPKGAKQGDYFSRTIGPYDTWAIEYGYKTLSGGTEGEVAELKKIAARWPRPNWPTPPTRIPAASIPTPCRIAMTWAKTRSNSPSCEPS